MSFLKYRYFLVLWEELSFQRVARRLPISHQGRSSQIHKLEDEYGLKFFERKLRVKLTVAGEHMMLQCEHILDAVDAIKLALPALKDGASGKIPIGTAQILVVVAKLFSFELRGQKHTDAPYQPHDGAKVVKN